jgi:hypothetical protein
MNDRPIPLGRQGENEATLIKFSINALFPFQPDASYSLIHQRPGEVYPHPVVTYVSDGFLCWVVKAAELATVGSGMAQMTALVDDVIAKTKTFTTVVANSIGEGEPPADDISWMNEVLRSGALAASSATRAERQALLAQRSATLASELVHTVPETVRQELAAAKASGEFDGENAEISDVYATVDNNVGVPEVEVTLGGTPQIRTFTLSFRNLKGSKGDQGDQGEPGTLVDGSAAQYLMHVLDVLPISDADKTQYLEPLRDLLTPHGYAVSLVFYSDSLSYAEIAGASSPEELRADIDRVSVTFSDGQTLDVDDYLIDTQVTASDAVVAVRYGEAVWAEAYEYEEIPEPDED